MATTLLRREQMELVNVVKGANVAAVWIVMVLIEMNYPGRVMRSAEVAAILGIQERTVDTHLKNLCANNRAVFDGRGFILTEGRALFLGMNQESNPDGMAPAEAAVELVLASKPDHAAPSLNASQSFQHFARAARAPLKKDIKKIEEDDFNLIKSSSSESKELKSAGKLRGLRVGVENARAIENLDAGESVLRIVGVTDEDGISIYKMQCADGFITARDILEATDVIDGFGDIPLHVLPVDVIKPELALAWVAKAYSDMGRLDKAPAGLVVARLRDIEKPRPPIRFFDYLKFLPDEYCARLRLYKYDCKSCVGKKFYTQADYEAHVQEAHNIVEQEVCEEFEEDARLAPLWNIVLDKMRDEIPKASFDTWLKDTFPVSERGGALVVAVRNSYAREWLHSRILDKISIHAGCAVEFVVASMD